MIATSRLRSAALGTCCLLGSACAVTSAASTGDGVRPSSPAVPAVTGFLDRTLHHGGEAHHYQVYVPRDYDPSRDWPVILFLHGSGERGYDGLLQTQVGLGTAIRRYAHRWPAIVVFPQAPPGEGAHTHWIGETANMAMAALDRTVAEFSTDPDRVYLTGLSRGGFGSWYLAYHHPERFAAVVPIAAWVEDDTRVDVLPEDVPDSYATIARRIRHLPIRIYHGDADPVIPVEASRRMHRALLDVGADVRYIELPGVGHNSWDPAYLSEDLPRWLLRQRRPR